MHDERLLPLADRVVELTPRGGRGPSPERVELAPGEVLFEQGDPVISCTSWSRATSRSFVGATMGPTNALTEIEPGGYFGELAPMFGLRRSAGARALASPVVVTGYNLRDFRERRTSS
jgi:CRP-like cAMP-binding protein